MPTHHCIIGEIISLSQELLGANSILPVKAVLVPMKESDNQVLPIKHRKLVVWKNVSYSGCASACYQ